MSTAYGLIAPTTVLRVWRKANKVRFLLNEMKGKH